MSNKMTFLQRQQLFPEYKGVEITILNVENS